MSDFRNPFRAERFGGYMPFLWYGSRFGQWLRLIRSGNWDITLNRVPNILGVTLMTPISSGLHRLTEAIYRERAEKVEVLPPIFVLGHWRSGTTFLHNLIASDPRHAFPTAFQCIFPGSFLLSEKSTGWIMSPFIPSVRPMDDVPLSRKAPFEDEFALSKLGAGSPYTDLAFPSHVPANTRFLDLAETSDDERRHWEETFVWLMRRFQLAAPGKQLVLKSPPHTARIATILKLFPDARFVHVARNPFEIYPSTVNLWRVLNSRLGLQNPAQDGWLPEHVMATLPRMYAAYERDVGSIPKGRIAEIAYERLATDPLGALADAYRQADLGDFAEARPSIEAYLATLKAHEPKAHPVTPTERTAIIERWQGYFDRFGYSRYIQ
jgi:hypothetical protein